MSNSTPPRKRLDSWKQIADHLGCCERTAHRYETKGIPVYRIGGQQHQRVFAYADELDHWLHEGGTGSNPERSGETDSDIVAYPQATHAPHKPAVSPLRLDITEEPDSGSCYLLNRPSAIIGRDLNADLV
jgi:hypothetical protein